MVLSSTIQSTLLRYQHEIDTTLRSVLTTISERADTHALLPYYGLMQYHLGWVDSDFVPTRSNPGKLFRPTLLLLAYEAANAWGLASNSGKAHLSRALPAAAAIELTHNFTLIHDDIEDGDIERRHRPTLWTIWGVPQALNAGDGMYALSRLVLWGVLDQGVEADIAARLGMLLDRTCLIIAEGQYLDLSFENRQDISVSMYIDMISRKTAALLACSAEMGALLGTRDQDAIQRLRSMGEAIGIAFQVRDDVLGIWATSEESGKTPAGDIYRRKKSLPILHALEAATPSDQNTLRTIYQQERPVTPEQVETILAIMQNTNTKAYCQTFLAQHCKLARQALASVPRSTDTVAMRALNDLEALVDFVEIAS
jgi:geranylgeranyl diphosphate synthase type I